MLRSSPELMGVLSAAAIICAACSPSHHSMPTDPVVKAGIDEASGIAVSGDSLLIVSDEGGGGYYTHPLPSSSRGLFPIDPGQLRFVGWPEANLAIDLESVDELADGRIVVLSERLRSVVCKAGVVAEYDGSVAEFGGRGLEGVAVRDLGEGRSAIALIWEGGYPSVSHLPPSIRSEAAGRAMKPSILVHEIEAGEAGLYIRSRDATLFKELSLPIPPGEEPFAQRFRAPDIVWHEIADSWGFIVLITSSASKIPEAGDLAACPAGSEQPVRYCYRRLQRFDSTGEPYGEPIDLDPLMSEAAAKQNWEGMAWLEEGVSLVLIHESAADRPGHGLVVNLPEGW